MANTKNPIILEMVVIPDTPNNLVTILPLRNMAKILIDTAKTAKIIIILSAISGYSLDFAMSKDIAPGPAIRGTAKGVIATLELILGLAVGSFSKFPSWLSSLAKRLNPAKQISRPPAIRNTSMVTPKNCKMYSPMKNEITSVRNTLIDAQRAVFFLDSGLWCLVRPKKMGRLLIGLQTEKIAAKVKKNKVIGIFSKKFRQK